MYLWKCWRETRVVCIVSLVCIAILFLLASRTSNFAVGNMEVNQLAGIFAIVTVIQALPIAFVAWLLGSYGVGRDLGEGSGSYLFTRPASRASFVWRDWAFGAAELLTIVVLLNIVVGSQIGRVLAAMGDPLHGRLMLTTGPVSLATLVALNSVIIFLLGALVFSLTYLCTVLVKNSKGVMLGVGLLLGYIILQAVVKHYWPNVELPPLIPREFSAGGPRGIRFADHLGLFLALRAAVILLFPLAAQFVLEKADL